MLNICAAPLISQLPYRTPAACEGGGLEFIAQPLPFGIIKLCRNMGAISSFIYAINAANQQSQWNSSDVAIMQEALLKLRVKLLSWRVELVKQAHLLDNSQTLYASLVVLVTEAISGSHKAINGLTTINKGWFNQNLNAVACVVMRIRAELKIVSANNRA